MNENGENEKKNEKAAVDIIHGNKHNTKQKEDEQKEHVSRVKEVKEVNSTGWGTVARLVHLQSPIGGVYSGGDIWLTAQFVC